MPRRALRPHPLRRCPAAGVGHTPTGAITFDDGYADNQDLLGVLERTHPRSIALHAAVAARLRAEPSLVQVARERVRGWCATSGWQKVLRRLKTLPGGPAVAPQTLFHNLMAYSEDRKRAATEYNPRSPEEIAQQVGYLPGAQSRIPSTREVLEYF